MACNDNWVYSPDLLYVPDWTWIKRNEQCNVCPERWTPSAEIARHYEGWNYIPIKPNGRDYQLSADTSQIVHGEFAGYQMINLAILMGATELILTGYDCQPGSDGRVRWSGVQPAGVEKSQSGKFGRWIEALEELPPQLEALDVSVINASRSTAVTAFPTMDLDLALELLT